MIEETNIDIFQANAQVLIQQSNCHCAMNSGIAKAIRSIFPEAYEADLKTVKGDKEKLGSYSCAYIPILEERQTAYVYVINLYSQFNFGRETKNTDYTAFDKALTKLKNRLIELKKEHLVLAIPYRIGCNLGGGDWNVVKAIIYSVFEDSKIKVLICKNPALSGEKLENASSK